MAAGGECLLRAKPLLREVIGFEESAGMMCALCDKAGLFITPDNRSVRVYSSDCSGPLDKPRYGEPVLRQKNTWISKRLLFPPLRNPTLV